MLEHICTCILCHNLHEIPFHHVLGNSKMAIILRHLITPPPHTFPPELCQSTPASAKATAHEPAIPSCPCTQAPQTTSYYWITRALLYHISPLTDQCCWRCQGCSHSSAGQMTPSFDQSSEPLPEAGSYQETLAGQPLGQGHETCACGQTLGELECWTLSWRGEERERAKGSLLIRYHQYNIIHAYTHESINFHCHVSRKLYEGSVMHRCTLPPPVLLYESAWCHGNWPMRFRLALVWFPGHQTSRLRACDPTHWLASPPPTLHNILTLPASHRHNKLLPPSTISWQWHTSTRAVSH